TFGLTHLDKIRDAYAGIAQIVAKAQESGLFRTEITPEFAAQAFYGSVEQVLTGWIFDSTAVSEVELERAKSMIVDTICRGLLASACMPAMLESPLVKRLLWSGMLAGFGALATLASTRVATMVWMRVFGEEPPE